MKSNCFVRNCGQFEGDTMLDEKPVQSFEMRRDMIMHSCADHDPGSSILNSL